VSRQGAGHRAIDLARMAGISTQQVRNYADAGILPAVPRTATGYRRFDETHCLALLAYRGLAKGCGPGQAQAIMRAVHAGDLPGALALMDASHASLHEQRLSLRATGDALEAIAGRTATLTQQATAMLEAASHLHRYITTDSDRGIGHGADT
jgi:DNA-binding transcriptional MerR regulator